MRKALIGGNHLITPNSVVFENKPLTYSHTLLDAETDLIIFFDQIGVKTLDIVDTYKNLPLVKIENFFRKDELPALPENTRLIFENSLRNYSRNRIKSGKDSALQKSMFNNDDEHIKCSCVGLLISLVEILFKRYEAVTFVAEKQSNRLRVTDVLKVQTAIPKLEVVWI